MAEAVDKYDIIREADEVVIKVDLSSYAYSPSVEDNPVCMSRTMDKLIEVRDATKIIFMQKRDYEYDYNQTRMLAEIAEVFVKLSKRADLTGYNALGPPSISERCVPGWHSEINHLVFRLLRSDPLGAYVELRRTLRREKIKSEALVDTRCGECERKYVSVLSGIIDILDKTKLIVVAKPYLPGYKVGDRSVYRRIFNPTIKPDFMFTKLMASYPPEGEELASYEVGNTEVTVFGFEDSIQYLYHIMPPEFKLSEEKYEILDAARKIMAEHKPKRSEFVDPQRMREVFYNVGRDLIEELVGHKGYKFRSKSMDELARILVRYTVGFGLIEVLLGDENIQDVSVNSPLGQIPIFVVHADFDDCYTNIIPTRTEAESWASKLRMISGRPLDEANQILDTELRIPGATARVSAITAPLDPTGLAFSFRRHRDKPWTLPLFMKYKMINPMGAGLLSFLIDGTRSLLIAGTRSSGKTSFLGSLMVEIMRRYRILTVEDTLELPTISLRKLGFNIQPMKVASALVKGTNEMDASDGIRSTLRLGDSALIIGEVRSSLRGDQEVVIVENSLTKRVAIKNLENLNLKSIYLPTLTGEDKMELKKISGFVKHPKRRQLIKLTTKTGRSVVVTPDHSVFTHINFKIAAINTDQLRLGDPIIIPSKLPCDFNDIDYINLLDIFKEDYRLENAEPYIRQAIKAIGWRKASKICGISDIYMYLRKITQKSRIPIKLFLKLVEEAKIKYKIEDLRIKRGTSNSIPAKFPINKNVMRFIGYYLAEGNIGKNVQITNSKPKIIEDITNICKEEFGLKVLKREVKGLGTSVQMNIMSKPLRDLLVHLGCGKTSFYKRIPEFVYGLDKKKICALLRGMYSGDGSFSSSKRTGNSVRYFSTAKKLVEDVGFALLSLGIVCRFHSKGLPSRKRCYTAEIKQRKYVELFLKDIGFTHKNPEILVKSFPHSVDDSVSFDPKGLEKHLKIPRKYRHLRRTKCCSKEYLKRITEEIKCSDELYDFAHGDFFIDKVKSVKVIDLKKPEHVYDLEVKSTQRFVGGFGGILLHNTEAIALYEAMRVGAAANVVAGTIHGDSPYGVFDRVVNDIGVPKTSFKATDVCVIANPVRSAGSLQKLRRITQITEVRKDWKDDPLMEKGFVDLMKYDAKTDQLVTSNELINGDSDILKLVASNIKEFAGSWDALWDNILLRAKVKETLVNTAIKVNDMEMLEAPFVIKCNDKFHRVMEGIVGEVGYPDPKKVFFDWGEWLKRETKNRKAGGK